MAIGGGLGGSVGIGSESTYGTFAVPTRWFPWETEKFSVERKFSEAKAIVSGSLVKQSAQTVLLTQLVKGSLKMPVTTSGMGLLLKAIMGTAVGPTIIGTGPGYSSVFTVGPTVGESLSVQIGRPQTNGTVTPFSYLGCKPESVDFTVESGGVAEMSVDFVGQQMTETEALTAPVYGTPNPIVFPFTGITLSASATIGSEVAMANVRKMSLSLKRKLDDSRYYIGGNGLLAEPIEDDFVEISGTISADFTDTTDWDTWVNAGAKISLILDLVGQQIVSGTNYGLSIAVPVAQVEGADPEMSGPKIVTREVKFSGENDNTHQPLTMTYTSTDTTL